MRLKTKVSFFIVLVLFSMSEVGLGAMSEKQSPPPETQPADVQSQTTSSSEGDPSLTVASFPPTPVKWTKKFELGWKKGFYFQTADKNYSLKFRGLLQPQFYYLNLSNKPANNPDQISFILKRAELSWEGNVFSQFLDYKIKLALTASSLDRLLDDAWLDYRFYNPLRIQFGQYKVPYNRQQIISPGRLQFVDRSIAADTFRFSSNDVSTTTTCSVAGTTVLCPAGTAGSTTTTTYTPRFYQYDVGLMVHGDAWDNKLEYYASITNGSGQNRINPNKDLLYIGRIVWNPTGQYGYQESDVNYSDRPAITVAASGGYLKREYDLTKLAQAGFELGSKYKGFSFQGEFYFRDNRPRGENSYQDVGYYAQAGYLFKKRFEIAGRLSQVFFGGQGSNNLPGARPNNKNEFTGGFNYYIFQHDLKVQTDYSYLTTQTANNYGATADHRLRLQLQAWF